MTGLQGSDTEIEEENWLLTEALESLQELVWPAQQEQGDDEGDEGQAGHHSGPHQDANTPDLMLRADPVMTSEYDLAWVIQMSYLGKSHVMHNP